MLSDLEVDADALRGCAAGVAVTAARVAEGTARSAPLTVLAVGWGAAEAAGELRLAADRQLCAIGDAVGATARQVIAAAAAYEAADDRAAGRLRNVR